MRGHDRHTRPRGVSGGSGASQQHVERMARARNQRALREDPAEQLLMMNDPEQWQRRTATRMLNDFTASGVDVDLEELRAGWSTNTSAVAQRHKRDTFFFDDDAADESLPALLEQSDLNRRGDVAARRLQMLSGLRQVAQSPSGSRSARVGLAITDGVSDLGMGGRSQPSSQRSSVAADLHRLFRSDSPAQSSVPHAHARRWRGPLEEDSDEDVQTTFPSSGSRSRLAHGASGAGKGVLALRMEDSSRRLAKAVNANVNPDDPWSAWESRWEEAFRDMDNMARAKRQVEINQQEQERRRVWEEADRIRQEDVRRQHERKADRSRFWEEAYKKASAGGTSSSSSSSSRRPGSGSQKASGANSSGPKPKASAPPQPARPPPTTKPLDVPRFASFAAYEEAWSGFDTKVKGDGLLNYKDIPWPLSLSSVSGAATTDAPAERKKKLRGALLRWHPDKWAPLFSRVKEEDKEKVTEQIKEVTRRILEEKQRFEGS